VDGARADEIEFGGAWFAGLELILCTCALALPLCSDAQGTDHEHGGEGEEAEGVGHTSSQGSVVLRARMWFSIRRRYVTTYRRHIENRIRAGNTGLS
jgi:hypothetical protein